LVYTYQGNQLQKVDDTTGILSGFKDGNTAGDDYDYDDNGNLLFDRNKDITDIKYNFLNLPKEITFTGSNAGTITYIYDATGTKLEKKVTPAAQSSVTTEYCMGYVYENGNLQFFGQSEGYIAPENGNYAYVFQFKDNLGNVRLSYTDADGNGTIDPAVEIVEESNYYPFGLKHKGYNGLTSSFGNSTAQAWKYQSQELTEDLGLNTYEWRFRNSDPTIGRFWQIDPLASTYTHNSTYAFAENKVIMYNELEGLEITLGYLNKISYDTFDTYALPANTKGHLNTSIFVANMAVSAINTLVGIFNYAGDLDRATQSNGAIAGPISKIQGDITGAIDGTVEYFSETPTEVIKTDVISTLSDPGTYEDAASGFITGGGLVNFGRNLTKFGTISRKFIGIVSAAKITKSGISKIKSHLKTVDYDVANDVMIERLEKIAKGEMEPTQIDKNYYTHELTERKLVKEGMSQPDAHVETVKRQGIKGRQEDLYTKEAIEKGDAHYRAEVDKQ